jgi:4-diphosphocytidyl-2-C-methyl-D-erythritol kinase
VSVEIAWGQPLPAPAKINLFLHVVGRRADGYHLLQTAFRFLDRCDEIRLLPRNDGQVVRACEVPGLPPEQDLCVRAARCLQQTSVAANGVTIELTKRLPIGGGLGGGSSDAATVLLALNRLWGLNLSREHLQRLALKLGADVPVFIFGRTAFAEGVGERLKSLRLDPAWYVVIEPGCSVPTASIFASPDLTRNTNPRKIADFSSGWQTFAALRNDLQPATRAEYPAVAQAIDWLAARPGIRFARMSGSGACIFAECESQDAALDVAAAVPAGWTGWAARGLDEHPLYADIRPDE